MPKLSDAPLFVTIAGIDEVAFGALTVMLPVAVELTLVVIIGIIELVVDFVTITVVEFILVDVILVFAIVDVMLTFAMAVVHGTVTVDVTVIVGALCVCEICVHSNGIGLQTYHRTSHRVIHFERKNE